MNNAFLKGDLVVEAYVDIPLGFETPYGRPQVCKLKDHCMVLSNSQELGSKIYKSSTITWSQ